MKAASNGSSVAYGSGVGVLKRLSEGGRDKGAIESILTRPPLDHELVEIPALHRSPHWVLDIFVLQMCFELLFLEVVK